MPLDTNQTDATPVTELPPVHPECKVYDLCRIARRVRRMRRQGDGYRAQKLVRLVKSILPGVDYQP